MVEGLGFRVQGLGFRVCVQTLGIYWGWVCLPAAVSVLMQQFFALQKERRLMKDVNPKP